MSRQGKIRLAEFFSSYTESDKRRILRDIAADVLPRAPKMCNIIEKGEFKFVYRRYASLYFVVGVPSEGTNELIVLEQIHLFVEVSCIRSFEAFPCGVGRNGGSNERRAVSEAGVGAPIRHLVQTDNINSFIGDRIYLRNISGSLEMNRVLILFSSLYLVTYVFFSASTFFNTSIYSTGPRRILQLCV